MASATAVEAIRAYHEASKYFADGRRGPGALDFTRNDPDNVPHFFTRFEGVPDVDLYPALVEECPVRAADALSRTAPLQARFELGDLARLLAYSAGITRSSDPPLRWWRHFPAASSAHSYPDVYVVCGDIGQLAAGVYSFDPIELRLQQLRAGDYRANVADAAVQPALAGRPATLVIVGVPWRAAHAYAETALRHTYWDVGSLAANMVAVSDAHGLGAKLVLGFQDEPVARLLGLDGVQRWPVALVPAGPPGAEAEEEAQLPRRSIGPLDVAYPPIHSRAVVTFPLIAEAHAAGNLASRDAVVGWRAGRSAAAAAARDQFPETVEPWSGSDESLEELILRRGTTRRFSPQAVDRAALDWPLAIAMRPLPGDWLDHGRTLLEHTVVVHAVEGQPAGVYRLTAGGLEPVRLGDHRQQAHLASAQQGQGGDGAYTTFHFAHLDRVLGALGPRGYRAAQVEAGYVLERLLLAAFGVGVGATGLGFYEDEAARLCGRDAAVMSEVAIGRPAYRGKPGGLGRAATVVGTRSYQLYSERLQEVRAALQAQAARPTLPPPAAR